MGNQRKTEEDLQKVTNDFKKTFKVDDSNIGKVLFLLGDSSWEKYLKGFFETLSKNDKIQLIPEESSGTVLINTDCEGLLQQEGVNDSKISLKRYDVFRKATVKGDAVEFYYDTVDITGPAEYFYKASVWQWTNYTTGWKEEPTEEHVKTRGKLFKTLLTNRDAGALAELQSYDGAICNLKTLFEGSYGNYSDYALKQYPQYRIKEQLPFSSESDYRNIENVGNPIQYTINQFGFYKRPGKIVFQKVKAQKYIRSVDRYVLLDRNKLVFGTDDAENYKKLAKRMESIKFLDDNQKLVSLSGKAYLGSPKGLIVFIRGDNLQLVKKYYINNNCCEQYKDKKTQKVFEFNNNLLERLI